MPEANKPKRPNILFITSDQHRWDHLGCQGAGGFSTPNLDRLAREGTHFNRAYTPSPLCVPCRVSLLTGQYPSSHYAYSIGMSVDPFPTRTLPAFLGQAGYQSKIIGKTHFVSRIHEAQHMAGDQAPTSDFFRSWSGPYAGFDSISASTGHNINNEPDMHYKAFLEDAGVDYQPWFAKWRENYDHHWAGPWAIPEEYHDTAWVGRETEAYIESRANDEDPWFCWASFQDPHEPFVCPEPWYSSVDRDALQTFEGHRPGEFDDRPDIYTRMLDRSFKDYNEGMGVPCSFGVPKFKDRELNALQATAGMVSFIDDRIGRMLQKLEATGQLENTVIVYTSDHGELHGHHGLWGKGLAAYDDSQRVPLVIASPGRLPAQGKTDALISLVDLPHTFLQMAGLDTPQGVQGRDLSPLLRGEVETVQDAIMVESRPTQNTLYQHTIITDDFKMAVYRDWDDGELYDTRADPDQYRNLWQDPKHRDVREKLLLRLARLHMQREGAVHPRINFG